MTLSIIGILVAIIVIGIVLWAARALIAAFSIPQPIATVIYVVLVLLILLWILGQLGVGPSISLR